MKKKYYLFTTSTNCPDKSLFNNQLFIAGCEMPPFTKIVKMVEKIMRDKGFEPEPNTTIVLYMTKLTKQEYEAFQK